MKQLNDDATARTIVESHYNQDFDKITLLAARTLHAKIYQAIKAARNEERRKYEA